MAYVSSSFLLLYKRVSSVGLPNIPRNVIFRIWLSAAKNSNGELVPENNFFKHRIFIYFQSLQQILIDS